MDSNPKCAPEHTSEEAYTRALSGNKDDLVRTLDDTGKKLFREMEAAQHNSIRCKSMCEQVFLNLLHGNYAGIQHQFRALGSCGNTDLNYKATKVILKIDEIGETAGINYYNAWIEEALRKQIPFHRRVSLFHSVHKSWIWPTYAGLLGVGPVSWRFVTRSRGKWPTPSKPSTASTPSKSDSGVS